MLGDLDRIEVIRGPSGTLSGANAVNGVVNVISKPAADTLGTQLRIVGGGNDRAVVSGRYGASLGSGHYRVYGKYRMREPQVLATGQDAGDRLRFGMAGFRFDSDQAAANRWSLFGDVYKGTNGFADREDGDMSGGHVVARWGRRRGTGEFALQAFYDGAFRRVPLQFEERRHAGEIDRLDRQRHRAGRDRTLGRSRLPDARLEGRTQQLHGHRVPAERPVPYLSGPPADGVDGGPEAVRLPTRLLRVARTVEGAR